MDLFAGLYLVLSMAFAGLFLDAPVKAWRIWRSGSRRSSPRYHRGNLVASTLVLVWAIVVWVPDLRAPLPVAVPSFLRVVGVLVAAFGLGSAVAARWVLRSAFAPTLVDVPADAVATHGPYHWVRHPFYTGGWLFVASGTLAVESLGAVVVAAALLWPLRVIAVEEERHLARTDQAYVEKMAGTGRFVPWWGRWGRR